METSLIDFQYEPYRRVPMNSATTQKDTTEFNSIGTHSTYSLWSRSNKTLRTTYIDGTTMLGQYDRPYNIKDLFPKGKNRQKPLHSTEKKNARDAYMSLLPADTSTVRSEKTHSPLSMATTTQTPCLPDVPPKSANIHNKRALTSAIFDDSSESKFYACYATAHTNGAWVRRFKSINESQTLSNLLRDPSYQEKVLFKKRPHPQLHISSSSSFTSSIIKRRREKLTTDIIESTGTTSQTQINDQSYGIEDEEVDESDMTGRIIANNYQIHSKLGAGSFGQVYLCEHIHTHQQWAMKIELHNTNNKAFLISEYKIYKIFQGASGFPKVDYCAREDTFNILIIELLGPSLEDLFNYCNRKFTLKTALMLVDQMVSRIEYVHTCHLIHRDIKPDNFLMGMKSNGNTVYIIDFGLSKRYRDPQSLVHNPWKSNRSLTGTARYASINAHKGTEQSRRDDLEAISYVFMYFLMGSLPWQGLQATAKKAKFERIAEMKMKMTAEQICKNYPKECVLFLNYCRKLVYDHRPDYDYLRNLFRYLLYQKGEQYDYEYDWIIAYRNKHLSATSSMESEILETSE